MRVQLVDPSHELLDAVIQLGDRNRATLGFLAGAAFEQAAHSRTLLAATIRGKLAGYALFALPAQRIRLAHLCVDDRFKHRGIARLLVDKISELHQDRSGIGLKCRRDYGLEPMWTALGFEQTNEVDGRGADRHPLVVWWRDHHHPNLFTDLESTAQFRVAMDLNVFADLYSRDPRSGREETQGLTASWIEDMVDLLVLPTLVEEIGKLKDPAERRRQLALASNHDRLHPDRAAADVLVREMLTRGKTEFGLDLPREPNDLLDLRYVAEASVSGVGYVVSRDNFLTSSIGPLAEAVCNVRVLRPSEIVVHVDELIRAQAYQGRDLLGTSFSDGAVPAGQEERLAVFLDQPSGERKSSFHARLRDLASKPATWDRRWILDGDGRPAALYCMRQQDGQMEVSLLRTAVSHPLAGTLARQLLYLLKGMCRDQGISVLRLSDPNLSKDIRTAAAEDGFQSHQDTLVALVVDACADASSITDLAAQAGALVGFDTPELPASMPAAAAYAVERAWWPAKITDAELPSFLVPIWPLFASDLFEFSPSLLPRNDRLGISRQHVYYRAARSAGERVPARILWYASSDKNRTVQQVIACSRLDDTVVDQGRALHARFQHLGVWERRHIDKAANTEGLARALLFSDTEIFPRPISLSRLRTLADEHRHSLRLQSVSKIPPQLFSALYREGHIAR
ncbi:GNAT family N-acetyltransferase [Actinacidiphila oryziradicis]|uniref:GNAT family N-acetyltransferase n=1 Tax=Actinacidiphila oryziradicis TaxID=2571141 RepID=A0A4U0S713_9ACTN|nr:GNAT family N-acetyltransferase [Actinacidiphila oryziradicis]